MSKIEFYAKRVDFFTNKYEIAKKNEFRWSILRLVSFLGSFLVFYVLYSLSVGLAISGLTVGFAFFGFVLHRHLKYSKQCKSLQIYIAMNQNEINALQGDISSFANGENYQDATHFYTSDLDVFGNKSLFQYINRTTTLLGSNLLAIWLKNKVSIDEISLRQKAIAELAKNVEWRQKFAEIGYRNTGSMDNPDKILNFVTEKPVFLGKKLLFAVIVVLSAIIVASCFISIGAFTLAFALNFAVYGFFIKRINLKHQTVSKTVDMLSTYSELIRLIENEAFTSEKLQTLQTSIKSNSQEASKTIQKLSKLVSQLDFRLNYIVGVPLNLFFFWDIHKIIQIERWSKQNSLAIEHWFAAIAEMEALSSLANVSFNNPDWAFPIISKEKFVLYTKNAGHPLIPQNMRVCNDFKFSGYPKIILVTGSNMSGKSTFQRTVGINIVLAMTGSVVCATDFTVSSTTPYTSMRIVDSLQDNTSSFYAELKRLSDIIKAVERGEEVFLILDEILRGTNSNDRHIGSAALIRQLIRHNAVGVIATHDLSLSAIDQEFPENIENYNFDVKIENDELFFNYKLNDGVCKSLNASILMKKMGIHC